MNKEERLNLQKMIAANDVVDQTTAIRKLKHADLIWNDVKTMSLLKNKYARIKGSETWSSVICKNCNLKQSVSNKCNQCSITFGEYYCSICKFYDNDTTKQQLITKLSRRRTSFMKYTIM